MDATPESATPSANRGISKEASMKALASFSSYLAVAPLDRIKLIRMTEGSDQYQGMLKTASSIIHNEGFKGLWAGGLHTSFTSASSDCVANAIYNTSASHLAPLFPTNSYVPVAASGTLSGLASSLVVHPLQMRGLPLHAVLRTYPICALQMTLSRGSFYTLSQIFSPIEVARFLEKHPALRIATDSLYGEPSVVPPSIYSYPAALAALYAGLPAENVYRKTLVLARSKAPIPSALDIAGQLYREGGVARFFRGGKPLLFLSLASNVILSTMVGNRTPPSPPPQ